jgi:hypothetical protein
MASLCEILATFLSSHVSDDEKKATYAQNMLGTLTDIASKQQSLAGIQARGDIAKTFSQDIDDIDFEQAPRLSIRVEEKHKVI